MLQNFAVSLKNTTCFNADKAFNKRCPKFNIICMCVCMSVCIQTELTLKLRNSQTRKLKLEINSPF